MLPLPALPLLAFGLTALLLAIFLKSGWQRHLAMDQPNQRSLHSIAVPRVGGIAMVIGILVAWGQLSEISPVLMLMTTVLAVVSYIDDKRGLPVAVRLPIHAAVATLAVLSGIFGGAQGAWMAAALIVGIVWATNAYNFMDGADGLAGGMAIIGFSAYGAAALLTQAELVATLSLTLTAAAAAFLLFNFPPATVFMGDTGSICLGFLAAILGLQGWSAGTWPLWFPLLVFSPFLVDASVTLLRRVLRGERFWQAHRDHYYQRLIRSGWSHRRTALIEYAWMFGVAVSAVAGLSLNAGGQAAILAVWVTAYAFAMRRIDARWVRFVTPRADRP